MSGVVGDEQPHGEQDRSVPPAEEEQMERWQGDDDHQRAEAAVALDHVAVGVTSHGLLSDQTSLPGDYSRGCQAIPQGRLNWESVIFA